MAKAKMTKETEKEISKPEANAQPGVGAGAQVSTGAEVSAGAEASGPKPRRHRAMPVALRVLCSVILLMLMSFLFAWFVIWRQNLGDAEAAGKFVSEKPALFIYSVLVIFGLMSVLAAVTWRVFFSLGLSFALLSILTFINAEKFKLRAMPLLPEDFRFIDQTGNLASFVDPGGIVSLIAGAVLVLVGSILLEHWVRKVWGRNRKGLPWWSRTALIPRVTFTMMALATTAIIMVPVIQHEKPECLKDVKYIDWNQAENYENNGFVIGFLYNLGRKELPEPENYSEETLAAIAQKYQDKKANDKDRTPINELVENVVIILDETFYDPDLFTKYYSYTGGDVVPNLHKVFRNYPSGFMYSPEYGGNTANIEFEVLTGLSNYWLRSFPYVNSIPQSAGLLSAASWTKDHGFATTAIHSYDGSMYKRNLVYPLMGYEQFIDADKMTYTEKDYKSEYINDQSVFKETLDILQNNDTPQMISVVTMQNHGAYDTARYPELDFAVGEGNYLLEANLQSIHSADEYLGEFLAALDELDEPTVVLWFGDHAAGVFDKYINSEDKEDYDTVHLMPYFIYTNFSLEDELTDDDEAVDWLASVEELVDLSEFEVLKRRPGVNLPVTTPNCLQNTLYNVLGAEKPALFYLVDEVCREAPVLTPVYLGEDLPESEVLKDYEIVNYDVLNGKQYWDGE